MNQADLIALRTPLLVLLAVLIVAAAAVYSTGQVKASAQKQLAQQEGRLFAVARGRRAALGQRRAGARGDGDGGGGQVGGRALLRPRVARGGTSLRIE